VKAIGVFVNQGADEINRIADLVGLAAVQLHGDERPELAAKVHRPVIKAVSVNSGEVDADKWPKEIVLLVDTYDPVRRGGTGREVDWPAAARLARERRVLLAGGLTPENVADAVAIVKPYGIDVSSGVESAPGTKDRGRIEALFAALRQV
jgi:phosphoribosylanthranilate isomerase